MEVCNLPLQDIAANYCWMKPLVEVWPEKVPGGIVLTDCWLYLDKLLDKKLLVKARKSKQDQASEEAERYKKLMGALRYLYRNRSSVSLGNFLIWYNWGTSCLNFTTRRLYYSWACFGCIT